MKRIFAILQFILLATLATSCGTEYFKICAIPCSEDLNPKVIPTEGYEGWFYLVEYMRDESVPTRTQMGEECQCYRYRLIIEDEVGPQSDDCNGYGVWVCIPRNQTGRERELAIEVMLAKNYHDSDRFDTYCNDPNNKFTEWMVAWRGIQEYVPESEDDKEEEDDDELIIVPFPPQK
ncbi:MAG: hypothetical protein IKY63_02605 [Tidjanibacter sp.]|nr:hypothetical protein [Tidjanibacter sp.]